MVSVKALFIFVCNIFRRLRSIIPLFAVASLFFYYSFQNELNNLNTLAENEFLPHISSVVSDIASPPLNSPPKEIDLQTANIVQEKPESDQYLDKSYHQLPDEIELQENDKDETSLLESTMEDNLEDSESVSTKHEDELANLASDETKNSKSVVDLNDMQTLVEKNKYFPLIQSDYYTEVFDHMTIKEYVPSDLSENLDLSDVSTNMNLLHKKNRYLLVENAAIKKSFQNINFQYPAIQANKYTDMGAENTKFLKDIRDVFKQSYNLYATHAFGADEVHPLSKNPLNNGNGFGETMLGSLDMLYLLDMKREITDIISYLDETPLRSRKLWLKTSDTLVNIVASLVSAYEFSHEEETVFLESAKLLASLSLRAFDTPNNLPLVKFPWKSELTHRFPLSNSKFVDLVGSGLELSKLSILLKDNIYYSTAHSILDYVQNSNRKFHIDNLFPEYVDASGCSIMSSEAVVQGGHLKSNVMKSISNGKFVFCRQVSSLVPIEHVKVQKYTLNNERTSSNYYFDLIKIYHLLNGHEDNLSLVRKFANAVEKIHDFMLFRPVIPSNSEQNAYHFATSDILFLSSLETISSYDPLTNSHQIHVHQTLRMDHSSCQAGSMFLFASKLLKNDTYAVWGKKLINGCVRIPELLNNGLMPESFVAEKCTDMTDCEFDADAKMQQLHDDVYFSEDTTVSETSGFVGIKVDNTEDFVEGESAEDVYDSVDTDEEKEKDEVDVLATENKNIPFADPVEALKEKRDVPGEPQITHNKQYILSVVPPESFKSRKFSEFKANMWLDIPQLPFFLNDIDAEYLLKPDIIESLFYAYRITGDSIYRKYAKNQYSLMMNAIVQVHGKGRVEISSLKNIFTLETLDYLPHYWFSKTLKFYYLIFSDSSLLSLDDYVFNNDGHPFAKKSVVNENSAVNYDIDWENLFD